MCIYIYIYCSLKLLERYEKCLQSHLQCRKNTFLHFLTGDCGQRHKNKVGEDRTNPGKRIFPLPSANDFLEGRMSG